jgi:hypothetical protein
MRGPVRSIFLAALAACGLTMAIASQATAATLEDTTAKSALLAVYGNPPETVPVGGGLGRNFGYGENMLFEADTTAKIGTNLSITIGGVALEAGQTYVGATVLSNKTGESEIEKTKVENPLSVALQFIDFQQATPAATYADTYDRPSIAEICGSKATCRVDPRAVTAGAHRVKIENISINVGPGTVVQGTVWGTWINGSSTTAPCIELTEPVVAADTLYETQGAAVGATAEKFKGQACLISANNNYNEKTKDAITLE